MTPTDPAPLAGGSPECAPTEPHVAEINDVIDFSLSHAREHVATVTERRAPSLDGLREGATDLRAAIDAQVCLVSNLFPRLKTADATTLRKGWDAVYALLSPPDAGDEPMALDLALDALRRIASPGPLRGKTRREFAADALAYCRAALTRDGGGGR